MINGVRRKISLTSLTESFTLTWTHVPMRPIISAPLISQKKTMVWAKVGKAIRVLSILPTVQQQLPVPPLHMIVIRALLIVRHIHILHPHLPIAYIAKRIHQRSLALANTLDLRTRQHNPSRIRIKQRKVKRRTPVPDVHRPTLNRLFSHNTYTITPEGKEFRPQN